MTLPFMFMCVCGGVSFVPFAYQFFKVKGGTHPAYIDKPKQWNKKLRSFLFRKVSKGKGKKWFLEHRDKGGFDITHKQGGDDDEDDKKGGSTTKQEKEERKRQRQEKRDKADKKK